MSQTKAISLRAAFAGFLLATSSADAATVTAIVNFNETNGGDPKSTLTADAHGNLYGTTSLRGNFDAGTIFKIDAATHTLTTLAHLDGAKGAFANGRLILDANGNLYGTATHGGASGLGTIFKLNLASNTLSAVSFNGTNGARPSGGLVADPSGILYGVTQEGAKGYGTLFCLDPSNDSIMTLSSLGFGMAGSTAPVALDGSGGIIVAANLGGPDADGTLYRIDIGSGQATQFVFLHGATGTRPTGGLLRAANGLYYGTASEGWLGNGGAVFSFDPATGSVTPIASFANAGLNGPVGGLIQDSAGNLYGLTRNGGANNLGALFKVDPITGTVTTIVSLDYAVGANPAGGLYADSAGNLYGTAVLGGSSNNGTVFMVTDSGFVVPEPTALFATAGSLLILSRKRR